MGIRFFNKSDNKDASLSSREANEFFINEEGEVVEFIEQHYADSYSHIVRKDVGFEITNDKSECDHKWVARWAHHDCTVCGAVMFGNSRSDRADYGIAADKTFASMEIAKFYQQNGHLPE